MKITAIDFETANSDPASVCAVGVSTLSQDGEVTDAYYSLIRPSKEVSFFSPWNIRIHGIHPEDVRSAPAFAEVFASLRPHCQDALVCAHNARFDMRCLVSACQKSGIPLPSIQWFDTVQLSRHTWPWLAHHRLNDVCDFLQVELDHHNACSDAHGCLMIVINAMAAAGEYDIRKLLRKRQVQIHTMGRSDETG